MISTRLIALQKQKVHRTYPEKVLILFSKLVMIFNNLKTVHRASEVGTKFLQRGIAVVSLSTCSG